MLERQIEELALLLRHLAVEAARESAIGDGAGDRIGLRRSRACPRNMLRGNWSSTRMSASAPSGVVSHDRKLVIRGGRVRAVPEARRDLGVEGVVLGEPFVRAGGAPEREHVHRRDRRGRRRDASPVTAARVPL